ncbi:MAG TPA: DUF2306 domain-containing protein [Steroidobacteraceae bacterium]|nr:DUF2306 domain-containing protein [Steroidobacteraceae bacterium]
MTPDPAAQNTSVTHFGPKHILFGVLGLLTLFVIYNNERFIVDHSDPLWTYYLPVHWLLLPHGLAGVICLCLGATQFSTRLRQRHARVHRVFGRSYVIGVVVAATISLSITMLRNELPFQMAVFTQAFLWMMTTAVAFYCIRRRNFREHRHWMIRSYAITLIFVTNRALDAIPGLSDLDTDASPNIVWLNNIIAWVVPTFIISWQNIVQSPAEKTALARQIP